MGFLAQVKTGIQKKPLFVVIYGTPKIGKTTFAADAEKPILIDIEGGSSHINTTRLIPKNFNDVVQTLTELASEPHIYKTVVIDSLDHLEPMIWESVCLRSGKSSIESFGYAKGYIEALKEWGQILSLLEKCRTEKGMNVICVAHSHVKTAHDPTMLESWDRFEIKIHAKASALFKELADCILFAREEMTVIETDKGKSKGIGEGKRVIYTMGMPGHEGGNRFNLPYKLALSYEDFTAAVHTSDPNKIEDLVRTIEKHLEGIEDLETKKKAQEHLKKITKDGVQLSKMLNRLKTIKREI